jgi:hypothetical protein
VDGVLCYAVQEDVANCLFQFIDKLYGRIYVFVAVKWTLLTRKADAE